MTVRGLTRSTAVCAREWLNPDAPRNRKYVRDGLRQSPWWHITKTLVLGLRIARL